MNQTDNTFVALLGVRTVTSQVNQTFVALLGDRYH
ncbi:hypothetical protein LILPAPAWES_11 [Morganella phage vB_MmoP_Lilpapawes]|uniref:Uncharacterized protein n=1 Tax=Morganella phage vB_MmoP_Lilpapawes TaxID=2894803 RepID=A0AAE8YSE9_9CAUD|nr:hypothetical protein LILPAPAWES_11 [Morganella phage vB_MmoP_Lilpapawes]